MSICNFLKKYNFMKKIKIFNNYIQLHHQLYFFKKNSFFFNPFD